MAGIDWAWLSVDEAITKASLSGKKTGPNPTDRGKTGTKRSLLTDGRGLPLALAGANVIDFKLLEQTLAAIEASRPAPTPTQPQHLYLDKGYDYDGPRQIAYDYGLIAHIRRGEDRSQTPAHPGKPRRWVVKRAHSWLNRYRRILVRWDPEGSAAKSSLKPTKPCSTSPAPSQSGSSSAYWNRL